MSSICTCGYGILTPDFLDPASGDFIEIDPFSLDFTDQDHINRMCQVCQQALISQDNNCLGSINGDNLGQEPVVSEGHVPGGSSNWLALGDDLHGNKQEISQPFVVQPLLHPNDQLTQSVKTVIWGPPPREPISYGSFNSKRKESFSTSSAPKKAKTAPPASSFSAPSASRVEDSKRSGQPSRILPFLDHSVFDAKWSQDFIRTLRNYVQQENYELLYEKAKEKMSSKEFSLERTCDRDLYILRVLSDGYTRWTSLEEACPLYCFINHVGEEIIDLSQYPTKGEKEKIVKFLTQLCNRLNGIVPTPGRFQLISGAEQAQVTVLKRAIQKIQTTREKLQQKIKNIQLLANEFDSLRTKILGTTEKSGSDSTAQCFSSLRQRSLELLTDLNNHSELPSSYFERLELNHISLPIEPDLLSKFLDLLVAKELEVRKTIRDNLRGSGEDIPNKLSEETDESAASKLKAMLGVLEK